MWADGFDWRAREREIRALPWATADLDGTPSPTCASTRNGPVGSR
ncbi:hypothetical protein [Clavibacter tessellarius]